MNPPAPQTKNASPAWLEAATSGGKQTGTKELAGGSFTVLYDAADTGTCLVDYPWGADTPTWLLPVLTAMADDAEVTAFTTALTPVQPR